MFYDNCYCMFHWMYTLSFVTCLSACEENTHTVLHGTVLLQVLSFLLLVELSVPEMQMVPSTVLECYFVPGIVSFSQY